MVLYYILGRKVQGNDPQITLSLPWLPLNETATNRRFKKDIFENVFHIAHKKF